MPSEILVASEVATFGRLEQTIAAGIKSFVEVGNALMQIRDRGLYRERHKTFEAYCQERWNLGRRQVNNLIGAADVVHDLGSALPKIQPASVRQAVPLARLPREERAAAWQEVVETSPGRKPTGKQAEKVVARRLAEREPARKPPAPKKPEPLADPAISEMLSMLSELTALVNKAAVPPFGHNNHSRGLLATLQTAIGQVKSLEVSWRNR